MRPIHRAAATQASMFRPTFALTPHVEGAGFSPGGDRRSLFEGGELPGFYVLVRTLPDARVTTRLAVDRLHRVLTFTVGATSDRATGPVELTRRVSVNHAIPRTAGTYAVVVKDLDGQTLYRGTTEVPLVREGSSAA